MLPSPPAILDALPGRTDRDEKGRRITGVDGKHMPIGDVAARTERSLRTTGHSAEARLVVPSPARTPLRP